MPTYTDFQYLTFGTNKRKSISIIIYHVNTPKLGMARGPDPEIQDIEILKVFVADQAPAFVPKEIGEALDVTTEGARHQMENLVDRGLLGRKKPGERTVLYWITEDGYTYYAENDSAP